MTTKQQKFILLRADGMSFDKIAKEIRTSKPTLIQWSKLLEKEIKDLEFEAYIKIKESYSWNKKKKYETLLKQLDKIDDGIMNADLTTTNLKDLFTIKNNILFQVDTIERNVIADPNIVKTDEYGLKSKLDIKLNEIE